MMRQILGILGVMVLLAIPSCGPGPIRIVSPGLGRDLTYMPVDLHVDLDPGADLATLVIEVNGVDVTAEFAIGVPPTGRIDVRAAHFYDEAVLLPGPNEWSIQVVVNGSLAIRNGGFDLIGEPYADAVVAFAPGTGAGFGTPARALGGPRGGGPFQGGLDVVSLGRGGSIELEFVDNVVVDGPGPDLNVFENAFLEVAPSLVSDPPYTEPGRVSVSQDGVAWYAFPCALSALQAPYHPGCAGVTPVLANVASAASPHPSIPTDVPIEDWVGQPVLGFPVPEGAGGDAFDLADLGLGWVRFVRIDAAPFETPPSGADNVGFDLDAVAAVNSRPFVDVDGNGVPDFAE